MDTLWYVLGSKSPAKELRIRDDVRRFGLESFVPLKYIIRSGHRVLVPAISGYVFVRGTLDEVKDYLSHAHFLTYIRKSTFSNKEDYLSVPLRAMENFIAVTEDTERHVMYFRPEEIALHEGDQIRVRGGLYDGREGVIIRIKGRRNKHLVVQIPGILIAAVEMSPDMIELTGGDGKKKGKEPERENKAHNVSRSKNLDIDRQALFGLAHRLLFEISDKYRNENEYYLLLSELGRAKERLRGFKGFTPAAEAELALPLYMAAVMQQEGIEEAQARLLKAIEGQKPSSLLRLKCQLYLAVLSKDAALLSFVQSTVSSWRQSSLSEPQRAFLQELSFLTNL